MRLLKPELLKNFRDLKSSSSYSLSYRYLNCTGVPLVVCGRDKLAHRVESNLRDIDGNFYVQVVIEYDNHKFKLDEVTTKYIRDEKSQVLKDALALSKASKSHWRKEYVATYKVDKEVILRNGYSYIEELDLVVSGMVDQPLPPHPKDPRAVLEHMTADIKNNSFNYSLLVADNQNKYNKVFTVVNDVVYEIPVTRDSKMIDGIYYNVSNGVFNEDKYYTFEDKKCPVVLYLSITEAEKAIGKTDFILARERWDEEKKSLDRKIRDLNDEISTLKSTALEESKYAKNRAENESAELTRLREQLKLEEEHRKADLEKYKAELDSKTHLLKIAYETKSLERKSWLEWFKFTPHIVTVATGVFTVIKLWTN